ncbi:MULTISPECIES: cytochrome P450 [Nonomuraea]|uniref:cytochrome P450 n=1 Tax=Nonomuraea TaxID=83681 RepID=UPI001C603E6B|nr:cytochrome P450 [Nonomuraea ceibae]
MTDSLSTTPDTTAAGCPFHTAVTMPFDGTPQRPSSRFAEWRAQAPATRMKASDGNVGWFVTRHALARAVLGDARFSQQPQRFPLGPTRSFGDADEDALRSIASGNLLSLDSPQHVKLRRAVIGRFSVKSAQSHRAAIAAFTGKQLERFLTHGSPADLYKHYAEPVSVFAHCRVLGIPDDHIEGFTAAYVEEAPLDLMFGFVRTLLDVKKDDLGEDVVSDLLRSELSRHEIEGILTLLMAAGRDAVAHIIATGAALLLSRPAQLERLRSEPALISTAVEEFVRYGGMFVSVFPRTATEDVVLEGMRIRKGESVWVSPAAANRDERRFANPDEFDVGRDAFGHLGFGYGTHGCVGQQLARVVIAEAITQLVAGVPSLTLVSAEQDGHLPFAGDLPTYQTGAVFVAWK